MSDKLEIVPALESDVPAITRLLKELKEVVKNNQDFNIKTSIQNCRDLMKTPAHFMLVAKNEGNVLGFVNFSTRKSIMHQGSSGLIDELIVSEKSRGSGIGKRLVNAVNKKCRELGCSEVEVSTEKSNVKARRFYKTCGFEEDAVLLEIDLK